MRIHFLKEDALIALKANVSSNLANYRKPTNEWIYDYFQGDNPFMEANFECEDFQLIVSPDFSQIARTEVQNARILYTALRGLSDTQATDERLWAGLCHYEFWDYIKKRRDMYAEDKLNSQTILSRYFFSTGKKRSLSLNTLAKLWWIGRWLYDSHRADPFELLKYFENDFTTKLYMIFSNNYMNNREIAQGVIEALMLLESDEFVLTDSSYSQQSNMRQLFLKATSFLNVFGGTHILDYFSKDEIKAKVIAYMLSLPHTLKNGSSVSNYAKQTKPDHAEPHYPSVKTIIADAHNEQVIAETRSGLSHAQQTESDMHQPQRAGSASKDHHPDTSVFKEHSSEIPDQGSFEETPDKNTIDHTSTVRSVPQMDDELVSYCEDMRMSYSYKAVLLLALLEHVEKDGKMNIAQAVPFFREFYRTRIEKGLPAELKTSIYSDLDVDDARILANITRNPLNALLLSNYFEYDSATQRFGFKEEVWARTTLSGRTRMIAAAKDRLARYYQDLA